MNALASGFGIALLVSMPPGTNTVLCVTSARDGARRAAPIIVSAAAIDVVYALLATADIIAVAAVNVAVAHWLAVGFSLIAAVLLWTRRTNPVSHRAVIGMALLNPGTATLWLGLSTVSVMHLHGPVATTQWVLGVAAGTTTWFSMLAFASSRVHRTLTPHHGFLIQRFFAVLLVVSVTLLTA